MMIDIIAVESYPSSKGIIIRSNIYYAVSVIKVYAADPEGHVFKPLVLDHFINQAVNVFRS